MLLAVKVRPEYHSSLPSIVHIDGTSRLQTVTPSSDPRFYRLLRIFEQKTGFPVLLNTSFNVDKEPIVETPDDALRSFASKDIDVLVMGDIVITKTPLSIT